MGDRTELIEDVVDRIEQKRRSKPVEAIQQNPIVAMLATLLMGGTVSGISTDQLFGGAAARAEADRQISAVVEATERASLQMIARINSAEEERDRAISERDAYRADFQACNAARLDERVAAETSVPESALEAAEGSPQ